MSSTLSKLSLALEEYYLEHNVFQGKISLAIDRREIEQCVKPLGYDYNRFCSRIASIWVDLDIGSGIGNYEYLAIAALQVAAGFRADDVDLPSDASYTRYLFEDIRQESVPLTRNLFFYGKHNNNKDRDIPGKTKQDFLWKSIRSHFFRAHGLELYIPEPRTGRDRFIQYPKAHLLFREEELKAFARKFKKVDGYINQLSAADVDMVAFRSWGALDSYFPQTARNRVRNEDVVEKLPLYVDQARRYLSRLAEGELVEKLDVDIDATAKLRQLCGARLNFTPCFLQRGWDDDYDLYIDKASPEFVEIDNWASTLMEASRNTKLNSVFDLVFVESDTSSEILEYAGRTIKSVPYDSPVVIVRIDGQTKSFKVITFETFALYAEATDLRIPNKEKGAIRRGARLRGGVRTSREAVFFPGLGPVVELPELYENATITNVSNPESQYSQRGADPGMWAVDVDQIRVRFSIDHFSPSIVSLPKQGFDLSTFSLSTENVPEVGCFFVALDPIPEAHIDLLQGTFKEAFHEEDLEFEELEAPKHDLFGISKTIAELPFGEEKEEEQQWPSVELVHVYPTHQHVWVGYPETCVAQIDKMLLDCYPAASDSLARRLYQGLNQSQPLIVADVAQAIALAKTTGSSIAYESKPFFHESQVDELHRNVVRHAHKAAKRNGGNDNRFVFVVVDLTKSETPEKCIDAIGLRYGYNGDEFDSKECTLPPNLYLTFILSAPARKLLRNSSTHHCPVYFVNGGWGKPVAGALLAYTPECFFQKT